MSRKRNVHLMLHCSLESSLTLAYNPVPQHQGSAKYQCKIVQNVTSCTLSLVNVSTRAHYGIAHGSHMHSPGLRDCVSRSANRSCNPTVHTAMCTLLHMPIAKYDPAQRKETKIAHMAHMDPHVQHTRLLASMKRIAHRHTRPCPNKPYNENNTWTPGLHKVQCICTSMVHVVTRALLQT